MTNEEAKMFLDNLKICINEHPVVADWLVEIANRKTEPTISKMEQVDKPQEVCDRPQKDCENCWKELHCRAKDEPQTERSE
jgi:hypothetical protein